MALMWIYAAKRQMFRFDEALAEWHEAALNDQFLEDWRAKGRTPEWADYAAECATKPLTPAHSYAVGMDRYFLLAALAQVRKCVVLLTDDGLPQLRNQKVLRLLRDVDEHWEQDEDTGRSLAELRENFPDLGPGTLVTTGKHTFLADLHLDEVREWLDEVESAIRVRAADEGEPFLAPGQALT